MPRPGLAVRHRSAGDRRYPIKTLPPPGGDALLREVRALRERGELQALLARYGAIDREKGGAWDELELVHEVARAYSLAGNPAKVEQYFLRCAELNPRRAALYHAQVGWYFQRKKRWARALTWYGRALETFPGYHLCLFRKGYCLERLHRPRAAVAALEAAVASYDGAAPEQQERSRGIQAQVLFHLARSLREIGETGRARAALDRCAEIDTQPEVVIKPEHRLASYGATYLRDGNPEAAIDCLEQARQRDPRSAVIWERLGLAYAQAGRLADAEAAFLHAAELPKGAVALISLARLHLEHERHLDAARCLGEALARHPQGEVQIRLEIADLHRRLGRPRHALEILGRLAAGRVPPQSTLAARVERRIADILLAQGQVAEALAHLEAALGHDPEDPDARERLAAARALDVSLATGAAQAPATVDPPLPESIACLLVESAARETGTIASYVAGRGFGFISHARREQTIFFHVSHVEAGLAGDLRVGTPVSFVVATNPRSGKPQAEAVRRRDEETARAGDSGATGEADED